MNKKNIYYILLFLSIYLPFEVFLLKWIPVSNAIYPILKQIPDLIIFSLTFSIISINLYLKNKINLQNKYIFYILLLFIGLTILSIFFNKSSYLIGLLKLKTILRYVLLLFIVNDSFLTNHQLLNIISRIFSAVMIQSIIGFIQLFENKTITAFFKPRLIIFQGKILFSKFEYIFGTMQHSIDYALFLTIGLIIWLYFNKEFTRSIIINKIIILWLLFSIYMSGSRIAFIVAIINVIYFYFQNQNIKRFLITLTGISLIISSTLAISFNNPGRTNEDFFYFLSPKFYKMLKKQRLGLIQDVLPLFIKKNKLIGLSPDKEFVTKKLLSDYNLPAVLKPKLYNIIEDVFWLAMLIYFGLIGLLLIAYGNSLFIIGYLLVFL